MANSGRLALIFASAFAALLLAPAFLSFQFSPYDLVKWGDIVDLATPLVLLPLYWFLFQAGPRTPTVREVVAFLVLAALWVEGQGMHLGANSIGHLVSETGTDLADLTHFYDEVLSHYLWHAGIMGLSALAVWREWRVQGAQGSVSLASLLPAAIIYGATFFVIVIEGATWPLGLPFAALVTIFGLTYARRSLMGRPLLSFFVGAHALTLVLFLAWAIVQGGLPEFSEVGIID
ncbi:MAG: hypothetical protein C1O27_000446 [Chloroflexi bacterium]|jgi:hypothetical protein|nr:MAG: hypothetical protein C1O27_000446 [Chloroflexota bacterium]